MQGGRQQPLRVPSGGRESRGHEGTLREAESPPPRLQPSPSSPPAEPRPPPPGPGSSVLGESVHPHVSWQAGAQEMPADAAQSRLALPPPPADARAWGDRRVRLAGRAAVSTAGAGIGGCPVPPPGASPPTSPLGSPGRPCRRKGCAGMSTSVHACAQGECEHAHAVCVCMCASHTRGGGFRNTPQVVFVTELPSMSSMGWSVLLWPVPRFSLCPPWLEHQKSPSLLAVVKAIIAVLWDV